ncbi:MAG: AbgT family transporter [Aerococcus sp.]|nr:AbgT family transporter [Aerococcus sp.]
MSEDKQEGHLQRWLDGIERIGNKLPHPVVVFMILIAITMVISAIVAHTGASVSFFDAKSGEEQTVQAVSLLNGEGIRYIFNSAVENFTSFAPLGTVLVAMLGVGVAEGSGLIGTALRKLISKVPHSLLTAVVVFAGIVSNIASDAGYVVVVPLGAIMFASAKRHPLAGLAAAFAGVSGGFSANLMFGPTDAILVGITNEALQSVGADANVLITSNWYFLIASTILLVIVGTIITEHVVEPHLGEYHGNYDAYEADEVTDTENRGLRNAGIALLLSFVGVFLLLNPWFGPLQEVDPTTHQKTLDNFMMTGLIFMLFLLFAIPGLVYGRTVGKINDSSDFVDMMADAMKSMGGYLVLSFFAAQLIAYFSYTNLGVLIASKGAEFLQNWHITGIPLVILFILFSAFINLFMGSASAKWAILAPIFVPMFIQVGLSPEMTQMAYRIADSSTNIITPLMSYFAMILVFMQRYDKDSGLGTLISTMLPYSMSFLVSWAILLLIWFVLQLPLGPGASVFI